MILNWKMLKQSGLRLKSRSQMSSGWSDLELEDVEAVWVEIKVKKSNVLLCMIYHPPNAGCLVMEAVCKMMEAAVQEGKEIAEIFEAMVHTQL